MIMDLSKHNWPELTGLDLAFPTIGTNKSLLEESKNRDLKKGVAKFNELFFNGGKVEFQDDVEGTWKEKAWIYARCLMGSFAPKHEDKEAVCAMIFQETLKL